MVKVDDEYFDEDAEGAQLAREKAVARLGKIHSAMQMKISGADWPEIAAELGYGSADAAARDVHQALEEEMLNNERFSTEVIRMIQLKRLDAIYQGLEPGIARGNARSGDIAVKAIDRISKLAGLDAPLRTQSQVDIDINVVSAEIERTKREIAVKRAELEASGIIDATIVEER